DLVLGPGVAVAQRRDVAVPARHRAEHQAGPGAVAGRDAALEVLGAECDVAAAGAALEPRLGHGGRVTDGRARFRPPGRDRRLRSGWIMPARPLSSQIMARATRRAGE